MNEPHIIKIDDGFCEWKFDIVFKDGENMCIDDITKSLLRKFEGIIVKKELIKTYDKLTTNATS